MNQPILSRLKLYQWQIKEIRRGIAEADAGDFATPDEVKAMFTQLTQPNAH